jgi:hypothetical protein
MIIFSMYNFLVGVLIGARFKVGVLIPVVILAIITVAIVGPAQDSRFSSLVCMIVVAATSIQIGYVGGVLSRTTWPTTRDVLKFKSRHPGPVKMASLHRDQ